MATSKTEEKNNSNFNFRDYVVTVARHWVWFAVSVVVICGLAYLWVIRKEPTYLLTEQVLIKDEDSGTGADAVSSMFAGMGLGAHSSNVYNEMITMKSPALMTQVVEKLGLCINMVQVKFPHGTTVYGSERPFNVTFDGLDPERSVSLTVTVHPDGKATLGRFVKWENGKMIKIKKDKTVASLYGTYDTPIGKVTIAPNPTYTPTAAQENEDVKYFVSHTGLHDIVGYYLSQLKADLADRDAEVIDLQIEDVNQKRASDVLRTIIEVYNQDWINDKNKISAATSVFIQDRLALIYDELETADNTVMDFRSRTATPDDVEAARAYMKTASDLDAGLLELSNQMAMTQFLKDYLNDPANAHAVIPVNTGTGSNQLETQIAGYNQTLLARNNLVAASSENNPLVRDYDAQLKGLRTAVNGAVSGHLAALQKAQANYKSARSNVQGEITAAPQKTKALLSVERQREVKNQLYLYLLQKLEENELSQKFTADNTRIITPPYGNGRPVSPKKRMILCIAFLLSLALPAGLLYVMEATNNRVRSRRDLESLSAPFAGEIPFVGKKKRFEWLRKRLATKKGKHKKLEKLPVVVEAGKRDVLNESFRIVRSNIDLMMRGDQTSNIIMMTSFNPGSGKSFVCYNLAASFAIKGKKVLVIDCDLRHGSASQFVGMPGQGLSQYLNDSTDDWLKLVVAAPDSEGLYVLPIGHRPPNPAELLENGRIGELINEASSRYDYVMMDCPPIDIVVDTQLLEKYVGQTIFVVRAGLLERGAVAEIDEMYRSRRFRRMGILLNGTEGAYSRAATYGSSYYTNEF